MYPEHPHYQYHHHLNHLRTCYLQQSPWPPSQHGHLYIIPIPLKVTNINISARNCGVCNGNRTVCFSSASSCINLYLSIELFELFWINYGHICTWELEQRQLTKWSSSVSINSQLTASFSTTFYLKIENIRILLCSLMPQPRQTVSFREHYEENLLRLYWVMLHVSIDVKVLEMTSSCVANLSCTSWIVLKLPCTSVSMAQLSCMCWPSWTWAMQFPHIPWPRTAREGTQAPQQQVLENKSHIHLTLPHFWYSPSSGTMN